MPVTVTMPQLGETVTEGTILSWAKQPGDEVAEDEILLEISTDKVDTEVPSPAAGVISEILVPAGTTVEVGTPLAVITAPGEATATPAAATTEPAPEPVAVPQPEPEPEPAPAAVPQPEPEPEPAPAAVPQPEPEPEPAVAVTAEAEAPPAAGVTAPATEGMQAVLSPVVRKLAAEHGLDLSQIEGTGQGGRITRKDVMTYIDTGAAAAAAAPAPPAAPEPAPAPAVPIPVPPAPAPVAPAPAPAAPVAAPVAAGTAQPGPGGVPLLPGDEVVDLSRLRTRIATNMIRSKQTAAHVWTSVEVDYESVEQVRQRHRAEFKAQEGFSLTYLPFIARATVDALQEFPVVNSSFFLDEGKSVFHRTINLGIAIDLNQGGLVVAPVRGADGLRLVAIARETRRVAVKARDGKLEPDDLAGATFTLTNPGPFGSFMSAPIINVPNTGILSTETVSKRAVVVTDGQGVDSIAIHHIGYLGLTWDHRAFDGSTAVLFLRRIKENLETWDWEQELA